MTQKTYLRPSTKGRSVEIMQNLYFEDGTSFATMAYSNKDTAEKERLMQRLCNCWNALSRLSDVEVENLARLPLHPSYAKE